MTNLNCRWTTIPNLTCASHLRFPRKNGSSKVFTIIHTLEQEQTLPISIEEAWEFFSKPRNLDEITPDDMGFQIRNLPGDRIYEGQIITYRVKIAPAIHMQWVTEIKAVDEGKSFVDEQRFGPYKFWLHRHSFETVPEGVKISDLVHYSMPLGPFGAIAHRLFVRKKLDHIFRHRRTILIDRFGR